MSKTIAVTPGFSPVTGENERQNRFNGFPDAGKPLKRLARQNTVAAWLKPVAKEVSIFSLSRI